MRALSPASSVKQPGIVAFEQGTAVAGGIALARDALTAKRTGRASNDNRTATRQVAYTSDGPAVDRNTACVASYSFLWRRRASYTRLGMKLHPQVAWWALPGNRYAVVGDLSSPSMMTLGCTSRCCGEVTWSPLRATRRPPYCILSEAVTTSPPRSVVSLSRIRSIMDWHFYWFQRAHR